MTNLSIRQLDRACLAVVILISIVCGYLAINNGLKKKQQFQIEKDIVSKKLKEFNLAETNLKELKALLDATRKELNILNERIPESGKIGLLLQQIDALMKKRNIALINLQPLPTKEERIYIRNPIKLLLVGTFLNLYQLICDIESMNRIVVMEKMTITKNQKSDECQVDLMTSVFER
jgi:Tfp pilus assembly protein PilO